MRKRVPARKPRAPLVALVDGARPEYLAALEAAGYRVASVSNIKEAVSLRPRPDAVIVEFTVPDGDLSQLSQAAKSGRRTRAMTVIGLAGEQHQELVLKAGASFCRHPCPADELVEVVKRVVPLR